ncbi:hypothetical protein ALC56_03171, partial [Trachymyrmex septentrionalis]
EMRIGREERERERGGEGERRDRERDQTRFVNIQDVDEKIEVDAGAGCREEDGERGLGTLARREVCEGLVYAEFPLSVTFRGVRVGKSLAPGCCKIPVKRCRYVKILDSEFAYSVVFTGKQDAAFLYFIQKCNVYVYKSPYAFEKRHDTLTIFTVTQYISWHFRQRSRRVYSRDAQAAFNYTRPYGKLRIRRNK